MPPNLKPHLGASTAIRNWSSLLISEFPNHQRTSVTWCVRRKPFCKWPNSCFWHDKQISPYGLSSHCIMRNICLPRCVDGTVVTEKQDHAAKYLAAWVLGVWVSPMLASPLAHGTHLDHATHGQQDKQWQSLPNSSGHCTSPVLCSAHPSVQKDALS